MKVYIVRVDIGYGDGEYIAGVYASRELAETKHPLREIEEFEVESDE